MGPDLIGVLKRRQSSNRDRYRGKMMRGNREEGYSVPRRGAWHRSFPHGPQVESILLTP